MEISLLFLFNSLSLGVGLSMDAFSLSLVNGMNEPAMPRLKSAGIAGVYGFFQALMPMLGWVCTHTIVHIFKAFQYCIPWVTLGLLTLIGVHMMQGNKNDSAALRCSRTLSFSILLVQGIATSIDALSVGFAIAGYGFWSALLCSLIIAGVTFLICLAGVEIGKKMGIRLAEKASVLGGLILIAVGIEILLTHIF